MKRYRGVKTTGLNFSLQTSGDEGQKGLNLRFKDTLAAVECFRQNAALQGAALINGDHKAANKAYDKIVSAKDFLLSCGELDELVNLAWDADISVRIWAARYLLFSDLHGKFALEILAKIERADGILAFVAAQTLSEFKKGNLSLKN